MFATKPVASYRYVYCSLQPVASLCFTRKYISSSFKLHYHIASGASGACNLNTSAGAPSDIGKRPPSAAMTLLERGAALTWTQADIHTDTDRHRQTQTDTQTHTDTHRHTQTQADTDRHTQTQADTDRHTDTQTHTDTHRHTQTPITIATRDNRDWNQCVS